MSVSESNPLDLQHLQRVAAILDGIPGDCDLPHAIIALEDAYTCCSFALTCGVSLEKAREIHRESITREETRRLLKEAKTTSDHIAEIQKD